jgi:hypothetical protein
LKNTPPTIGNSGGYIPNVSSTKDDYQMKQKQAKEALHRNSYTPPAVKSTGSSKSNLLAHKDELTRRHSYNPLASSKANLDSKRNLNTADQQNPDTHRHNYIPPITTTVGSKRNIQPQKEADVVSGQNSKYIMSKNKIDVGSRRALFNSTGNNDDRGVVKNTSTPTWKKPTTTESPKENKIDVGSRRDLFNSTGNNDDSGVVKNTSTPTWKKPTTIESPKKPEQPVSPPVVARSPPPPPQPPTPKEKTYTAEEEAAVLKLQCFVRGALCRARVSDMILKLIEELMAAEQQEGGVIVEEERSPQQQRSVKEVVEVDEEIIVDETDNQGVFAALDVPGEDIPKWWMDSCPHAILLDDDVDEAYAVEPPPILSYNDELIINLVKRLLGGHEEIAEQDVDGVFIDETATHGIFAALDVDYSEDEDEVVQGIDNEEDAVEELIQLSVKRSQLQAAESPVKEDRKSVTFVEEKNQIKEIERVMNECRLPQWWMDHSPHAILPYDEVDERYAVVPPAEWSDDEESDAEAGESAPEPSTSSDQPQSNEEEEEVTNKEDPKQQTEEESSSTEWLIDDVRMKRSSSQSYAPPFSQSIKPSEQKKNDEPDVSEMSLADRMKAFQKGPQAAPAKRTFKAATFR